MMNRRKFFGAIFRTVAAVSALAYATPRPRDFPTPHYAAGVSVGIIQVYDCGGTLLATCELDDPAFAAAGANAEATGVASSFRATLVGGRYNHVVIEGNVGTSPGHALQLNTTKILAGDTVRIGKLKLNWPSE